MKQMLFGKKDDPSEPLSLIPRHVAVIMDGNGRWAKNRFLPRLEGHRAGANAVKSVVESARRLGIRYLTVYAFSTENWGRPQEEVSGLMSLFQYYLENELELFAKHNVRLRAIGDRERLPPSVREALARSEAQTFEGDSMDFILAVSYGGRDEIVQAARSFATKVSRGEASPHDLNELTFREYLFASDVPDPELLIRTSGEFRISNFLLWQLAYAEIIVTPVLWPDFTPEEFSRCLKEFANRPRRFGLTEHLEAAAQ